MFSAVFRFSSLIFLIGLKDFSPSSHSFFQQFPHWAELALEEEGNFNNMIFGVENFQSESYMMTTIILFDFYCNVSLGLALIWSLEFLIDLRTQLFTLRTQLFTIYATELTGHLFMYNLERYSALVLSADCLYIKAWGWIILGHHLMMRSNQLVRHNQISSLVQSSALLSYSGCTN